MQDKLEALIASGQDSALARFTLGELYHREGDHPAAIDHLARAVALDENYSAAWKLYGRTLGDAGQPEQAARVLARGIEVARANGDNQAAREMEVFARRLDRKPG